VLEAGLDPARLPPGQYLTYKWPVLHVGSVPVAEPEDWRLRVWGEVENEVELGLEELRALPATEVVADIHCVTRWSRFDAGFRGVRFAELARPTAAASFVVAHAVGDYRANVPLAVLDDPGSLVAYEADGQALTPDHGGPLRLVVPSRYFWKSAKWLLGLEVRVEDEPGTWERLGYSNDADPWAEERYSV
jgi:DMSO/TMAO reductase YedYZ molybdopterin-dependent catalytic subunit